MCMHICICIIIHLLLTLCIIFSPYFQHSYSSTSWTLWYSIIVGQVGFELMLGLSTYFFYTAGSSATSFFLFFNYIRSYWTSLLECLSQKFYTTLFSKSSYFRKVLLCSFSAYIRQHIFRLYFCPLVLELLLTIFQYWVRRTDFRHV